MPERCVENEGIRSARLRAAIWKPWHGVVSRDCVENKNLHDTTILGFLCDSMRRCCSVKVFKVLQANA